MAGEKVVTRDTLKAVREQMDGRYGFQAISTTYANLVSLRSQGKLIPSAWYRITDYVTTTAETNTTSAGHQFDILVQAIDASHLNESAFATHHSGDTYFANSKLDAWELKYCLDNDTDRFGWADTVNGKGVIYYMKDEFNNELAYDFKNIIYSFFKSFTYKQWGSTYEFVRDTSLDVTGYYGWRTPSTPNGWSNPYCFTDTESITTSSTLYSNTSGSVISMGGSIIGVSLNEFSSYTFNYVSSNTNYDASLEGKTKNCYNNSIGEYRNNGILQLNWTIFYSNSTTVNVYNNTIGNNFSNNTIGNNFYNNIIGNYFYSNTIGNNFYSNTIGNDSYYNTIGDGFSNNTIGNNFYSNTIGGGANNIIGNYFYSNTIGNYFSYNIIGNNSYSNTIGAYFRNSTIGNDFSNNTIGDYFSSNTIGNYFGYNTTGTYFQYNTIGNYFSRNTIGNNFGYNTTGTYFQYNTIGDGTTLANFVRYCRFDDGVNYIKFYSSDTSESGSNYIQNVHIALGVAGASTQNPLAIVVPDRALTYETTYRPTGSVEVLV